MLNGICESRGQGFESRIHESRLQGFESHKSNDKLTPIDASRTFDLADFIDHKIQTIDVRWKSKGAKAKNFDFGRCSNFFGYQIRADGFDSI